MKRREFLASAAGVVGVAALGGFAATGTASARPIVHNLPMQTAKFRLRNKITEGLISLSPNGPPPTLRIKQGQPALMRVQNGIDEYTAVHWHGIRVPNAMDGVPYLTQLPIAGGETFDYAFTPPDAGTYWYHPHCMTMTQMTRGLTGVLVVEESENPGFDSEQVVNLRDFRLDEDDNLLEAYTLRGASRGGTKGNVRTANWLESAVYNHPTGGLTRLRIVNTDISRIYSVFLKSEAGPVTGRVIAWDGNPVRQPLPMPVEGAPTALGPGQRMDIAVQMGNTEGNSIELVAQLPGGPRPMVTLKAMGASQKRQLDELEVLQPNPVPVPDLDAAELKEFVFGWAPSDLAPNNGFCGTLGKTFWAINRKPWAGDAETQRGPLADLTLGRSYIFRFRNESPNAHPIHLHGMSFLPLRSNQRAIASNWTDTALVLKNEVMDVALVADNPGDWAFHCHIIEHQKTGLAGVVRVS